ncbi:MAG: outer membrane lipoprotein carrier protein LolA [Bacteroidales bacterium]|nr:outer membrane lipoprotein carrier protein LolA [Bacteroidales bacterium]
MKRLFFILSVLVSIHAVGQTRLSADEQDRVLSAIDRSASEMKCMQCDFTQTKTMKMLSRDMQSKGVMYFRSPDKLRWQYNSPYKYVFILSDGKIHLESSSSVQNIDVKENKIFRQIAGIMLGTITGGGLKGSADFNVEMYKDGSAYFARLYPKKKEVKQIYDFIEIWFNPSLTMVSSVKMVEKTSDVTVVKLLNVNANGSFDDKVFVAN